MSQGYAVECSYLSGSSDNLDKRTLLPLTLLFDGRNWIFRAFCREEDGIGRFKNFNFARVLSATESLENKRLPHEELHQDKEWTMQVPLLLVPHGRLSEKEIELVKRDYGMHEGKLIRTERAAMIWYLKELWCVDDRSELAYQEELKEFNEKKIC